MAWFDQWSVRGASLAAILTFAVTIVPRMGELIDLRIVGGVGLTVLFLFVARVFARLEGVERRLDRMMSAEYIEQLQAPLRKDFLKQSQETQEALTKDIRTLHVGFDLHHSFFKKLSEHGLFQNILPKM